MSTSSIPDPSVQLGMFRKTQVSCVKSPVLCKYTQFRVSPTNPHRKGKPPFLLNLCPGSALPVKARLQSPCCSPTPAPDATARAGRQVLLTYRRCSRGVAPAWLDTHSGNRALLTVPAMPRAKSSLAARQSQPLGQASSQRKTRASPSRENAVISRCFVLPTPPPSPRGARFGGVWFSSESTSATVSVLWAHRVWSRWILLQKLAFSSVMLGEFA